ncbi:hypothetical protein QBC45DRAFT_132679 [Copromyces sp. CBS 386.78]|nr:hypothetical protein QBC45DRAFT_132679 [Copromyces sp. CBS 386.78]
MDDGMISFTFLSIFFLKHSYITSSLGRFLTSSLGKYRHLPGFWSLVLFPTFFFFFFCAIFGSYCFFSAPSFFRFITSFPSFLRSQRLRENSGPDP